MTQPSITWLNLSGDVTITWDEQNRDRILSLVRAKMEQGFSFFQVKEVPILGTRRKTKLTQKNLSKAQNLVLSDAEFERLALAVDDPEVAELVGTGTATLGKRQGGKEESTVRRLREPHEVVASQSIALRPLYGG